MATLLETDTPPRDVSASPVIIATDGTHQSEGALAVGRMLAGQLGAAIEVVAAQPSFALIVPDAALRLDPNALTKLSAELEHRGREQCEEIASDGTGPALANCLVERGDPEKVLSRLAEEHGAQLVVLGIGRHDVVDRIFGSETALKVAQTSPVHVLAVPEQCRTTPHVVVVGVDFSEASFEAAQTAARLLTDGGTLHLVHVVPRERLLLDPWISDHDYEEIVRRRFDRLRARLSVAPNVKVNEVIRSGEAARTLIAYAAENGASLIAAGSHGHGLLARLVLGSVTTGLLRGSTSCVLVVPPRRASDTGGQEMGRTVHAERAQWGTLLDDFARANAGRRTRMEIDDPDIGAQAQEQDYPLRGITFDPHDQRVDIMLGLPKAGEAHLSRSIGDVTSLDVVTDNDGNDLALRVRHGAGQTVLTFV